MKLQDQLVNLELSKQLKECGYKQEGLWLWVENSKDGTIRLWFQEAAEIEFNSYKNASFSKWKKQNTTMFDTCRVYSAPTATELGERLPFAYDKDDRQLVLGHKYESLWTVGYEHLHEGVIFIEFEDKIEANARAKMWLYLKKEGLI